MDDSAETISRIEDPKLRLILSSQHPWFYRMYRAPVANREIALEAFRTEAARFAPLGYRPSDEMQWEDPPPRSDSAQLLYDLLRRFLPRLIKPDEVFLYVTFERTTEGS